jgi:glycosyltransferase involved in cell wall biosynthesis
MYAPALFLIGYPISVGYAVDSYIGMFYAAARELNDGDESRVHFGFASLTGAPPRELPSGFANYVEYSINSPTRAQRTALQSYVRSHDIKLVMLLDVQPLSPLVAVLRAAGAQVVISYWGAPVGGPQSRLVSLIRRTEMRLASGARVDSLVFESHAMADLAVKYRGCRRDAVDVVPLGVDPSRFRVVADRGSLRHALSLPTDRLIVLFSGHTIERKGIDVLLQAAVKLLCEQGRNDLFFLLCGDRDGQAEAWLRTVAHTGVQEWVRFGGYRKDMPQLMAASDIGVIPTKGWESFTVSVLEFAASGIPVVATRTGGLPEAVADGQTGLIAEPGDPGDLARQLAYLANNPDERRRMGRNGRERVEREFTLEAQRRRMTDVFRRRLRTRGVV